jgi:WD40 repeat protein
MRELTTVGSRAWTVPGESGDQHWLDDRHVLVHSGRELLLLDVERRQVLATGPDCSSTWSAPADASTVLFSDNQDVILWDHRSGERRTLSVPGWWSFYGGAASADGATIALASSQGSALLLERATGEVRWQKALTDRELTCVAFSADGAWVAFGAGGGVLTVLRTEDGQEVYKSEPLGFNHEELLLSRDGTRLALLAERGVYLLDTTAWHIVWQDEEAEGPYAGFWSADGTVLYGLCWGKLSAWRGADGAPVGTLSHQLNQAALSPDGTRMLFGNGQRLGIFAVTDPDPSRWQLDPRDEGGPVDLLAFSPDGDTLYTGSHRHDLRSGETAGEPLPLPAGARVHRSGALFWSTPEGTSYAPSPEAEPRSYPGQGELHFDASGRPVLRRTGRQLHRTNPLGLDLDPVFLGYGKHHNLLLLSPDGRKVAVSSSKGGWEIWDLEGERLLTATRRGETYLYRGLWLDPDTLVLDHPAREEGLVVLRADTLEILRPLQGPASGYRLFTCVSGQVVGLQDQRAVILWDTRTGERLARLERPGLDILASRLSPDGTRCAVSFADRTVTVWEV